MLTIFDGASKAAQLVVWLGCAALAAWAQGSDGGGSVAGQVVGGNGNGVAGVTVMVTRAALSPGEANPGVFLGTTGGDGTYSIAALGAGDYNVCVSDDSGRYLNPCIWSGPVHVSVAAGENKSGVQVQVEEAAELGVDVSDPEQKLTGHDGQAPAASLMLGIPAPYIFLPASAQPDTAGMKHYKARVPYDRDLELNVVTDTLSVADEKGNKLKKGGDSIPVKVPRGQGKKVVALTVTGIEGGN